METAAGAIATYRVVVTPCAANGHSYVQTAHQLGITGLDLDHVYANRLYFLQGDLNEAAVRRIAAELLADPVTEQFTIGEQSQATREGSASLIEVTLLPGVTDPPADSLVRAAHLLGIDGLARAATGQQFLLEGDLDEGTLQRLAAEVFANPVIQRFAINRPVTAPFVPAQPADDTIEVIRIRDANDGELLAISQQRRLALNLEEMQAIRAYYQGEGRDATDVELETLAQTWSEHCVHKTFRALIDYTGPDGDRETIDGLLNTYIRGATEEINRPWVRSAFVDNAGIVAFDEQFDLAFKVETHNHPSALEPFGGANTGVGGVVRDVLGVSARPIANTDILCFGPPDLEHDELPHNVLHPRRIAAGVVHGIEDYGNKMGIPTVNGSIHYHPGYTANPLVYCGCLGILPHGSHPSAPQPGDAIVAIGGRTGRDGLRGATFSSMEMDVETSAIAGTAVQIGNPIVEKQVQEVVLRARDERLYSAITDCGAGGYSSAVGEMGEGLGATVQLERVRLKYPGLRPWEIWLSEAQERMVLAVPPANVARLQAICDAHDVELTELGTFTGDGHLRVYHGDTLAGELTMAFLHDGLPRQRMTAVWQADGPREEANEPPRARTNKDTPGEVLLKLLAHPDIRSKEEVVRRYDHEVQGGTAVKPLHGVGEHGPGDATVLVPQDAQFASEHARTAVSRGVALANGINPRYGQWDPYAMAWAAVDEAVRNVVATGADPDQIAILDNFCWGNPNLPDRLGSLVRCAQGCHDAAIAYQTPFISGKDSLNNEYTGADGEKHAIPGTLLISALGIVPDVTRAVTMDAKQAGNVLVIVGETSDELGASHYHLVTGEGTSVAMQPPQPVSEPLKRYRAVFLAMQAGLIQSAHDCSEGGLAVALAEMALAGRVGIDVDLDPLPPAHSGFPAEVLLFSESAGRLLLEVRPDDVARLAALLEGIPHATIGAMTETGRLRLWQQGRLVIDLPVADLETAWRGHVAVMESRGRDTRQYGSAKQPSPRRSALTPRPRVLILHARGTNRDHDAALACELAGGTAEIVSINALQAVEKRLADYQMLVIPGGFSYGDDLGAGALWALDLRQRFGADLRRFVDDGRPVLGICNGFQALVKAGILGAPLPDGRAVTLTYNENGHFECRWVTLQPNPHSPSLFTDGLRERIYCPVAHGEGRLAVRDGATLVALQEHDLIALQYSQGPAAGNGPAETYPENPNGSALAIAALTNVAGNVMGLMPHPENHVFPWQHPRYHRGERGMDGLQLFINGMKHA
ncbi:MAG: phosphoribosylformylglycinamidine synthase subunit PurL [Anaerolineae bacterium]|nr:phosphoribosylformylglycinamidine synthase subunit PurL [Anaerolineae bacterium]